MSWAFHESDECIERNALTRFIECNTIELLEQGIDEDWDAQQFASIIEVLKSGGACNCSDLLFT